VDSIIVLHNFIPEAAVDLEKGNGKY